MDTATALKISELTQAFYARHASSFSATRTAAWPGWRQMLAACELPLDCRVLDLACGNMRLLRFLEDEGGFDALAYYGADACTSMPRVAVGTAASLQQLDIVGALADGTLAERLDAPACHLSACFGFLHHVPHAAWRVELLRALAASTAPGGFIAVAFWQFLDSQRLAAKAEAATRAGCRQLGIAFDDPCDALLGWQDAPDTFRYCHHFTEAEIDRLVAAVPGVREVARFSADGTERLNRYAVLQRSATSTKYELASSSSSFSQTK